MGFKPYEKKYFALEIYCSNYFLKLFPWKGGGGCRYEGGSGICLKTKERKKCISVKFWKRPSTIQLEQLFKQNDYNNVLQLSLFVKVIIAKF